jgi:hypothetical protein
MRARRADASSDPAFWRGIATVPVLAGMHTITSGYDFRKG